VGKKHHRLAARRNRKVCKPGLDLAPWAITQPAQKVGMTAWDLGWHSSLVAKSYDAFTPVGRFKRLI